MVCTRLPRWSVASHTPWTLLVGVGRIPQHPAHRANTRGNIGGLVERRGAGLPVPAPIDRVDLILHVPRDRFRTVGPVSQRPYQPIGARVPPRSVCPPKRVVGQALMPPR